MMLYDNETWSVAFLIGGILQSIIGVIIGNGIIGILLVLIIFIGISLYLKLSVIQEKIIQPNMSEVNKN